MLMNRRTSQHGGLDHRFRTIRVGIGVGTPATDWKVPRCSAVDTDSLRGVHPPTHPGPTHRSWPRNVVWDCSDMNTNH